MEEAQDRNVLLISPDFFNYSSIIKAGIENFEYNVDWYSDRNGVSFFKRALLRIKKSLLTKSINKYLNCILRSCENKKYSYIIVVNGEVLTESFLAVLRAQHTEAKFILYMWDALDNFKDSQRLLPYFDSTFTFDKIDSEKYKMQFLPLFYYEKDGFEKFSVTAKKYDYAYIGTVKKGKLKALNTILALMKQYYSNGYLYLFLQKRLVFLYYKMKDAEFKRAKMKDFRYKRMPTGQCNDILMQTNIVVDVPMKNQNGLTIRTIETLSRGQKLLTTNEHIKEYDFYREDQIYVYQGGDIDFTQNFFQDSGAIKNEEIEKYYIDEWLKRLLELE